MTTLNAMTPWKKCNSCKKDIHLSQKYYECSVSTCTGKRTGLVFCSVPCWERHVPMARHRDASAIELKAPSQIENETGAENVNNGIRRIIPAQQASRPTANTIPRDVLIVASKLKDYIKARADMNTSASVIEVLSDKVRRLCDDAIDEARAQGRKTVLDRDFRS